MVTNRVRVAFDTETREKVDTLDRYTLLEDQPGGQHGIQTTREQCDGFARCFHCTSYQPVGYRHDTSPKRVYGHAVSRATGFE